MNQVMPKGYKQTKVGVIPEDWDVVKLEEIATFYSGGTPTSNNKEYYNGNIPFIGSGNIEDDYVNKFITKEAFDSSSAKLVKKGDLLYALYGANSGEVAISKMEGAINQAILCIRSKKNLYFLYQYLLLKKDKIISTFLQGGQGNLSSKIIKEIQLNLPLLKEQEKIAKILTTWDDAILTQDKLIKAKEELKKGLMQKLLSGEIRFDGFFDEWEDVQLKNKIFKIIDGDRGKNYPSQNDIKENGYCLFLNTKNVTKNGFNFNSNNFITLEKDRILRNGKLEKFDIVLTTRGTIANIAYFDNLVPYENIRINSGMIILRTQINTEYLYKLLNSNIIINQIKKLTFGSAQPQLTIKDIKTIKLKLPSLKEQQKIAEVLTNADKEIDLHKNEFKELKEQKKGLMQKLLTGEVRVKVCIK